MRNVIERTFDVRIYNPFLPLMRSRQAVDFADGVVTPSARTEPITRELKASFPIRFQRILHHCLLSPICDRRDAERSQLSVGLWDIHTSSRVCLPGQVPNSTVLIMLTPEHVLAATWTLWQAPGEQATETECHR